MKQVVSADQALKEVNAWLDSIGYSVGARIDEQVKMYIDLVVESVQVGDFVFESDDVIVQKLKSPLGEGNTKEIKYDFRFKISEYRDKMKGKSINEGIDYNVAKMSLLSGQVEGVFLQFMKYDYSTAAKLLYFF